MEPIINEYFRYKSITEIETVNARLEAAKGEIDDDALYAEEGLSSNKLFGDEDED